MEKIMNIINSELERRKRIIDNLSHYQPSRVYWMAELRMNALNEALASINRRLYILLEQYVLKEQQQQEQQQQVKSLFHLCLESASLDHRHGYPEYLVKITIQHKLFDILAKKKLQRAWRQLRVNTWISKLKN